jgi:hypothetical protein
VLPNRSRLQPRDSSRELLYPSRVSGCARQLPTTYTRAQDSRLSMHTSGLVTEPPPHLPSVATASRRSGLAARDQRGPAQLGIHLSIPESTEPASPPCLRGPGTLGSGLLGLKACTSDVELFPVNLSSHHGCRHSFWPSPGIVQTVLGSASIMSRIARSLWRMMEDVRGGIGTLGAVDSAVDNCVDSCACAWAGGASCWAGACLSWPCL